MVVVCCLVCVVFGDCWLLFVVLVVCVVFVARVVFVAVGVCRWLLLCAVGVRCLLSGVWCA